MARGHDVREEGAEGESQGDRPCVSGLDPAIRSHLVLHPYCVVLDVPC